MSKYKFMNGKELANFILSKDRDVEFSFATEWPEDVAEEDLEKHEYYINTWYGIKQTRLFDSDVVIVGHYGGGHDTMVYDIGITDEYLGDDLRNYLVQFINDGTTVEELVCVNLEKVERVVCE